MNNTIPTPIGRLTMPPGHFERARAKSDQELADSINNARFVDPVEMEVAFSERGFCQYQVEDDSGRRTWKVGTVAMAQADPGNPCA